MSTATMEHHHRPPLTAMDCSLGRCFFKVFLPELSSQHLTIPPAFRQHLELESRSHGPVSLTGPSGSTWCVDLATNSKGLCFDKGWSEFVADQSVQLGDFLVFRYDRSFHFTVWLFDTTACQKKSSFSASPRREVIVVNDESDGGAAPMRKRKNDGDPALQGPPKRNSPTQLPSATIAATMNSSTRDRRSSPRWPQKGNEKIIERSRRLEFSVCDTNLTKSKPNPSTKKALGKPKKSTNMDKQRGKSPSPSSVSTAREVALRVNSEMTEEFCVPGKWTNDCSAKPQPNVKQDKIEGRRIGSLLSRRRPVTDQEVKKAFEMALLFKSKNPFVIVTMRPSYIYTSFFMHIPLRFTAEHLSLDSVKMTLWDPDGKSWPVNYSNVKYGGQLCGGWTRFSYDHNLESDDVCVFELIEKNQFKVHIFRVVEEVVPYIRITKAMCERMSKS